jgi:cAMP and cAMP-inhibited cGMP 3',5'-cyclic phosphodiesterase 10
LSASAKPWEVQNETVKGIFEEFYDQGDAEKAAGRTPMAMMDRNQPDQQANSQVRKICGKSFVEESFFVEKSFQKKTC